MKHQRELITLYFGKQLAGCMYDEVQEWAITYDLSIEDATNDCYKYMTWSLSEVNNNWQSHFDIMFSSIFKCLVFAPDIGFEVFHTRGLKTPTLLLKEGYVTERYTRVKHLITTQVMNAFGKAFEKDFGLEYLGFEPSFNKKASPTSSIGNGYRSRPRNSVLYLINGINHFYDGRKFILAVLSPNADNYH